MATRKIGGLLIDLQANVASLRKDMQRANTTLQSGLQRMTGALRTFGAAAGAYLGGRALLRYAQDAINAGDELGNLSTRTGVAVESLAALRYGAEQSGASFGNLQRGLKNISEWSTLAAAGNEQYAAKFRRFGISVQDSAGALRPTTDILEDIADKIQSIPPGAARMEAAMRLVGVEAGPKLLPMLVDGRDGLVAFREEAERLGLVISTETARSAEEMSSTLTRLDRVGKGLTLQIMQGLIPAMNEMARQLTEGAANAGGFVDVIVGGIRAIATPIIGFIGYMRVVGHIFAGIGVQLEDLTTKRLPRFAKVLWMMARGDFRGAWQLMRDNAAESMDQMSALWSDVMGDAKDVMIETGRLQKALWGKEVPGAARTAGAAVRNYIVPPLKEAQDAAAALKGELDDDFGLKPGEKFGQAIGESALEDRRWREYVEGWSTEFREEVADQVAPDADDQKQLGEAGALWAVGFAESFATALKDGDAKGIFKTALGGLGSLLALMVPGIGGIVGGGALGIAAGLFAAGGYVSGPGGPTDDMVPAWLSNGEYVVRAAAVDRIGVASLDAINEGRAPGFAAGGYVGAQPARSAAPSMVVNVRALDGTDAVAGIKRSIGPAFKLLSETRQAASTFAALERPAPRYA